MKMGCWSPWRGRSSCTASMESNDPVPVAEHAPLG